MRTSEQIDALAKDLAKAHQHLKNAVKSAENPHFKSKYADLAVIRDTTAPVLANWNLAIVQTTDFNDDGRFYLLTRLIHVSGQWIESAYPLPFIPDKPQIMGSAITYARRYTWSAICGISAGLDDDGEAARVYDGNGSSKGVDSAWSRKAMDPLGGQRAGAPSARASREPFKEHDATIKDHENLLHLDQWWQTNQPLFASQMDEGHENRLFINFMTRGCEIAAGPQQLKNFWKSYKSGLAYLASKDKHEAEVLEDRYNVTLDGFNLTSG